MSTVGPTPLRSLPVGLGSAANKCLTLANLPLCACMLKATGSSAFTAVFVLPFLGW